jgi:enolase
VANIDNMEAFEVSSEACEEVGSESGCICSLGVDVAASSLWDGKKKKYVYSREGVERDSGEQIEYIRGLIKKYRLVYVEDPFHEEDFNGFAELTRKAPDCLVCGDDLFATNTERLRRGINKLAANSVIIKVNQVGTLTDAWEAMSAAEKAGYATVMSHRSGDTCDWHIAHLAVAFKCPIIKSGVVGGARIAKINELIRIEEFLGDRAEMAALPTLKLRR